MAVVPQSLDGPTRVVHHRRVGAHQLVGVDHLVDQAEVPELLATLLEDPLADSSRLPSADAPSPPEVLVCGHGRRDPCCGRWGTLLHLELEALGSAARVRRCSHTGGHRFAPTAITLPDGRAWAFADADLLHGVIERTGDVAALARHDRGNSALGPWAQAVDRALFGRFGWAWLGNEVVSHTTEVSADGRSAHVATSWDDGHAEATVVVTREYPVLVCGEPPEAATKSSYELGVELFTLLRA
jgi:hypothetical protein